MQWSKFISPDLFKLTGLRNLICHALTAAGLAAAFSVLPAHAAPAPGVEPYTREAKALFDIEVVELKNKAGDPYYIYFAEARDHCDRTRAFYTLDGYAFTPRIVNILAHVLVHHEYESGPVYGMGGDDLSEAAADSKNPIRVPVIVGVSHSDHIPFVTERRTWDFTPKLSDDLAREFPGGGGDEEFIDFLVNDIKNLVKQRYPDIKEDMIFGHSFAGLLVLNLFLQKQDSFTCYFAASPSVWWGYSQDLRKKVAHLYHDKKFTHHLTVSRGSSESPEHVLQALKARSTFDRNDTAHYNNEAVVRSTGIPWPKVQIGVDGRSGAGQSSHRPLADTAKQNRNMPAGASTAEALVKTSELTVASNDALEKRKASINSEDQIMNIKTLVSVIKAHSEHPEQISFIIFAKQSHGSSIPFAIESALKHFSDNHIEM